LTGGAKHIGFIIMLGFTKEDVVPVTGLLPEAPVSNMLGGFTNCGTGKFTCLLYDPGLGYIMFGIGWLHVGWEV
jgi:hypothetical protein